MELYRYQCFNSSLRYRFIYRLGGSTGFFSEYNNMVLAIHYCLINKIQFVLESEDANFSSGEGWREFFLPFCKEIKNKWLHKYNYRIKPVYHNRFVIMCIKGFIQNLFICIPSLMRSGRWMYTESIQSQKLVYVDLF